ncbi:hypothetical protein OH77DRAFT_1405093, partial [Trametes cingulata]
MAAPISEPPRSRKPRTPLPGAETGRPETAREFAKRIKRLTVHGPREQREEGANGENHTPSPHDQRPEPAMPAPPLQEPPQQESQQQSPDELQSNRERVSSALDFLTYLTENTEGVDLLRTLRGRYAEDPFFRAILEQPKQFKNFRCEGGLIYLRENQRELLCVPNVLADGRSVREVVILHAHSLLAHLGTYKTLSMLRDQVWWKT